MGDYKEAREKAQACLSKQKDISLSNAVRCMNSAGASLDALETALHQFQRLSGWRDADQLAETCRRRIKQIRDQEEADRQEAKRQAEAARLEAERQAEAARLEAEHKAEAARLEAARKAEAQRRAEIRKQKRKKAITVLLVVLALLAIAAFFYWNNVIKPQQAYDRAMELYSAGKYEEAIVAFESLNGYKDSVFKISECETAIKDRDYDAAMALYDAGKYEEAISAFKALNGHKDSSEQIERIRPKYYKQLSVGATFYFGKYEQDNYTYNGKEDIEWLVLAKEDDKILVVSKYALDCIEYNTYGSTTWETCSLRSWLNDTFWNAAFSSAEQSWILSSTVTADKNPDYDTSPGNNTTDKVFLLSITEVNSYFDDISSRECQGTVYCYAQGAYKDDNGNCWWWLRSPGYSSYKAAAVRSSGFVSSDHLIYRKGGFVSIDNCAVRPALWISLG